VTPDSNWAELNRLFDEAADLTQPQLDEFIARVEARDADLALRLARMLDAHQSAGPLDRNLVSAVPPESGPGSLRDRAADALSDRYVLEETLGVGGTAAVFLAQERKHGRKVVIKVLQPDVAALIGTTRFRDEVQIAARLSHPHILALIDSGESDGLLYYVMPFVGGQTLRQRLEQQGRLTLAEAIALLRDTADALAHAHAAGIVHRDLKPENVLCVGSHAFLLDFGVAKLEARVSRTNPTDPRHAVGTPGYMAPEQMAGEPVDHRSDIYVWGLLAREILTGRRSLDSPLEVLRPDVPRSLSALIGACTALDPFERPQSADALVAALDGQLSARPRRRWPAVAALLLLAGAAGWLLARGGSSATVPSDATRLIAVTPLRDETGDSSYAAWGRLAGDWITQGLHEAGMVPVVPWQSSLMASEFHERSPGSAGPHGLLSTMEDETGAGLVISGSYYRTGDSLRFQAMVSNAHTGELLAAPAPVVVSRDSAASAVGELRQRLMGAVALLLDERLAEREEFTTLPPTYEAYRAFDRGLAHYSLYEYPEARAAMLEAWGRDTTFVPALVFAAFAAMNGNDWAAADSLIQRALARRSALNEYYESLADYLAAVIDGDMALALRQLSRSAAVAPGSYAAYNSAYRLQQLNRPAEADSILASMNPDRGPMREWPAYWSQRAYNNHLLARFDVELGLARAMRARHPSQRVTWVIEARALAALGRNAELDSLITAARQLEPDVYWSLGAMLVTAAEEFRLHGGGSAEARYLEAKAWLDERLAVSPDNTAHWTWLAWALTGLHQSDSAERVWLRVDQADPGRASTRGRLAVLAARRGDTAAAERWLAGTSRHELGVSLFQRARVAAILGDESAALKNLGDALRAGVDNWHWHLHEAWEDLALLHDHPRFAELVGTTQVMSRQS
jgi:tRNA A-37 threonylcarbamoyl transferase component Bud32/tetratricopeptide (TPR) repeat protein